MKAIPILMMSFFLPGICAAQFVMEKQVLSCGGGVSASAQFELNSTLAQTVTGTSASANYILNSGFWVPDGQAPPSVCIFGDDFSDQDASDWIPTNGTWSAATGSLVGSFNKKADNVASAFTGFPE